MYSLCRIMSYSHNMCHLLYQMQRHMRGHNYFHGLGSDSKIHSLMVSSAYNRENNTSHIHTHTLCLSPTIFVWMLILLKGSYHHDKGSLSY